MGITPIDLRYHTEKEMYEYYKSLDYSDVKDYRVLFSNREDYMKAVKDRNHAFHDEALIIWKNRNKQHKFYLKELSFVGNPDF